MRLETTLAMLGILTACGGGEPHEPLTQVPTTPPTTISGIAPSNVSAGTGTFSLTITGTHFIPAAIVKLNGIAHATTVVSATEVHVAVADTDVARPGGLSVSVTSAAGDVTAPQSLNIVDDGPVITSTLPELWAGGRTFAFEMTVDRVTPNTIPLINGVRRNAIFSAGSTHLSILVDAADIATKGTFTLTLRDTLPYRGSHATVVPVQAIADLPATSMVTIPVFSRGMAFNAATNRLYFGAAGGSLHEGFVYAANPATGALTDSVYVGNGPTDLALSDDGTYLYVGTGWGVPPEMVVRVHVPTMTVDQRFNPGGRVLQLAAMPGSPGSVIVSAYAFPTGAQIAVYDNGIRRPTALGSGEVMAVRDATTVYGVGSGDPTVVAVNSITGAGVQSIRQGECDCGGSMGALISASSRLFMSEGHVLDPVTLKQVGFLGRTPRDGQNAAGMAVDAIRGRAFQMTDSTVTVYDINTYRIIGRISTPNVTPFQYVLWSGGLVRWGTDGLAFRGTTVILLLRAPSIAGLQ